MLFRDPKALWHPSPNFGDRREGALPDMIVLHYTAMAETCGARDWLCTPEAEVSAHYLISTTGELIQITVGINDANGIERVVSTTVRLGGQA